MIKVKINLAELINVRMEKKGQNGIVKGIFLPIKLNHFYEGKDGNLYLDLIGFDLKNPQDDQTHLIKQSLPKEARDAMTEDEQRAMPILGNANVNFQGGGSPASGTAEPGKTFSDEDDLPF